MSYKTFDIVNKFDNINIRTNSLYYNQDVLNYLDKIIKKYSIKYKNIKDIKNNCINELLSITSLLYDSKFNIISDYNENKEKELKYENNLTIIFNINNFERLLLNIGCYCILINLTNFSNEINKINKYIFGNTIRIYIHPYYIIFGKIWIIANCSHIAKHYLDDYILYIPNLYIELNIISTYLNILYKKMEMYFNSSNSSNLNKNTNLDIMKKIMNDKEIQSIFNKFKLFQ